MHFRCIKRTTAGTTRSGNRSPKRRRSPLPKVSHKNLLKRPYDCTVEENEAIVKAKTEQWFANLEKKKPKAAEFPDTPEEKAAVLKMLKTLEQPPPKLTPDYECSILKSVQANKWRSKKDSASRKSVAQLGEQQKTIVPPAQSVFQYRGGVEQTCGRHRS